MMEQLLVFSRVQQRTLSLARQDPTSILRMTMLRLSSEIRAAEADISIAQVGRVHADMDMLAEAFGRLLDNAIKFRQQGVRPRITVEPAHDEAFWRLQIRDNGPGVEPGCREKAFRMFHRLNGEDAYPGVGAGLTISRRIARRHGGDVHFLDSDEGTCVEIALPYAEVLH
jgi:light-regulated signal transduction histidine kinase (bacteriophytochrome)